MLGFSMGGLAVANALGMAALTLTSFGCFGGLGFRV